MVHNHCSLLAEMATLRELLAAQSAALAETEARLTAPGLHLTAAEEDALRKERARAGAAVARHTARLRSLTAEHGNMWERALSSYKWVHHLPTVTVGGQRFASIEDWVSAAASTSVVVVLTVVKCLVRLRYCCCCCECVHVIPCVCSEAVLAQRSTSATLGNTY
jgi:hypothetical protein